MQSQNHTAVLTSPDLLGVLKERQAQAQAARTAYPAPVAGPDTMLYWLARAAKELRETAGRKQVHVAAEADKDQSSVYRFEQGIGWPRDTDRMVAAYAADLDLSPIDVWDHALRMWRDDLASASELEAAADTMKREGSRRGRRAGSAPARG